VLKGFRTACGAPQSGAVDEAVRDVTGDPHEHAEASEARLAGGRTEGAAAAAARSLLLRAQQGLEYEEIAAALATTPGAARVHYHHAVRRLKEIVKP